MKSAEALLFRLLRAEICGDALEPGSLQLIQSSVGQEMFHLAGRHSIAHLPADGCLRYLSVTDPELKRTLQRYKYGAVSNYANLNYCVDELRQILKAQDIPFIFLKGTVVRRLYPEPWMRSCSDIDILVPDKEFDRALLTLEDNLYRRFAPTPHDISLISPKGVKVELHRLLIEPGRIGDCEKVLSNVWEYAKVSDGAEYVMKDEMFYFYHLAHMAKHIVNGGCGIRPFIDLWLLNHRTEANCKSRRELLVSGGMAQFEEATVKLSEYWFGGKSADEATLLFSDFIIRGGVLGTKDNSLMLKGARSRGALKFFVSKTWMPYRYLCSQYPRLKGRRYLQPYYEIKRWIRGINDGSAKKVHRDITRMHRFSDQKSEINDLRRSLGL